MDPQLELYRAKLLAGHIHAKTEEAWRKEYLAKSQDFDPGVLTTLQTAWLKALHAVQTASGLTTRLEFGSVKTDGFTSEEKEQIDALYARAGEVHRLEGAEGAESPEDAPKKPAEGRTIRVSALNEYSDFQPAGQTSQEGLDITDEACVVKIGEIRDLCDQIEKTLHAEYDVCVVKFGSDTPTEPWQVSQLHDLRTSIANIDTVRCSVSRYSGRTGFTLTERHAVTQVLKQLHEQADKLDGIEKLPDEVAALTEADSGYHLGA